MFAEVVHGLLTNVLKASGSDQPSVDAILPQPKWRIGIIPAGMLIFLVSFTARSALKCTSLTIWHCCLSYLSVPSVFETLVASYKFFLLMFVLHQSLCLEKVQSNRVVDVVIIGAGTVWAVWAVAHTDF